MDNTITIVYRDLTPAEAVALGEHPKARASSWSDLMEERDRIERNRDMWKDQCAAQAQQIAQDRADAARYQWLLHAPVSKQDIWLAYLPEEANTYADRQIALAAMKEKTL